MVLALMGYTPSSLTNSFSASFDNDWVDANHSGQLVERITSYGLYAE